MTNPRNVLVVRCTCGGWVMVGALGVSADCDRDSFREAGDMVAEGFSATTMTMPEYRKVWPCPVGGGCTTGAAPEVAMEAAGQLNALTEE